MPGNDNNAPASEVKPKILGFVDPEVSPQELINLCNLDKAFSLQCTQNEQELWTYLLHRDYPQWGVIGNPKEYYIRIASVYGIKLREAGPFAKFSGRELLEQQAQANPGRLTLQIQVGKTDPFPVADVVARTYSGALSQVLDNLAQYKVTDPDKWIFKIKSDDLGVEHLTSDWLYLVRQTLMTIFSDNRVDEWVLEITQAEDIEAEHIAIFDLLQCQAGLCDILATTISRRLRRLADEVSRGNIVIDPVKIIKVAFGVVPGEVVHYFQTLSNLLFINDAFTQEIIDYYRDLIYFIPGIKLSLLPRGYPFIKRENIDKFDVKLFHVDPLVQPKVLPDYLNAPVFGEIDTTDEEFQMWRSDEKPYPIISRYPSKQTMADRMEIVLPGIKQVIEILQAELVLAFPHREAGFIIAGGMFSIIFDDYLSTKTNWLLKTDVDFFVYGKTHEFRVRAFEIIMRVLTREYPMGPSNRHKMNLEMSIDEYIVDGKPVMAYSVLKSVVTAQRYEYLDKNYQPVGYWRSDPQREVTGKGAYRLDQHERSIAFQVINTNSKDGFEVIMNFDTSHIQVGFDCFDGWIATPYWELYYPRREALLVRYNMRGGRFTKALYRGFALKTLLPYALLLKMSGTDYASVIRPERKIVFKPEKNNGKYPFPDDLKPPNTRNFSHRATIRKRIVTKDVEIIVTGDNTELENPSTLVSVRYKKDHAGEYDHIDTVVTDVRQIFERIKYDGQFKNGFDGYVNSAYLTFKIASLPEERHMGYNKLSKFLLRDARIVTDPRNEPVQFPNSGTEMFKWSIMTEALVHSKVLMPYHEYILLKSRNLKAGPAIIKMGQVPLQAMVEDEVLELKPYDSYRLRLDSPLIYSSYRQNPDTTRAPKDTNILPRHNLSLVVKPSKNLDFPHPRVFSVIKPPGNEEYDGVDVFNRNKKEIIHRYFNFPITIEGVVSFKSDEDFDALDLHAPMLSDEERQLLPRLTYEQFTQVVSRKLVLDTGRGGFQYLVEFPASVSESIFLDECDWTMPLDEVLGNRELRFNSICIFESQIVPELGTADGKPIEVKPAPGDEEFFANPPSALKIFRSFLIIGESPVT